MSVISNIVEGGVAKGEAGDGELRWHTDHGFMERPAGFTMLLAREVPAQGRRYRLSQHVPRLRGAAGRSANKGQGLPPESTRGATARPASAGPAIRASRATIRAISRARSTPIVRTHPETGRKALFLGRRFGSNIPAVCRSRTAKRCWTSSGITRRAMNSPGPRSGRSAIWSSGTTAAPCTAATASPTTAAAACTG